MNKQLLLTLILACFTLHLLSCATGREIGQDICNDNFPEAQAGIRTLLHQIYQDAMDKNIEGLSAVHLNSPKFTKFGPRSFERQTVDETNISEASFFSSLSNLQVELREIKVDVFGDIAIATFYPHFTLTRDNQEVAGSSRQTLVFLKTDEGWKIVHEHGTAKN